ncbi:hypothetical protein BIW11_11218 [Tropilaelaps mercedesae]|uniref:Uncharacterized protein n=1 Tax=Tropilaelaps mercedesae TaxID=418985 RepID=A0A1V9XCJ6_9ACAR|nr:hypothetical protein BIW11_11218 [Tropilaelaps mercedesae]
MSNIVCESVNDIGGRKRLTMIPEAGIMQHPTRPAHLNLNASMRTRPHMTATDIPFEAYHPDYTQRVTDSGDSGEYGPSTTGVSDVRTHVMCGAPGIVGSDTESGELTREPRLVIGVKFIADLARWSQDPKHGVTILGSILLDKQDEQMPGDEVRRALLCQLPEAPVRFLFLSHNG